MASFASSYIGTSTVAVTRNADVLTYPMSGNLSQIAGTAYVEITSNMPATLPIFPAYVADGSSNSYAALYTKVATNKMSIFDNTTETGFGAALTYPLTTVTKVASFWGGTTQGGSVNGSAVTSGAFDGSLNAGATIGIGYYNDGTGHQPFGTIRNVRIYPTALSASRLQALTT